MGMDSMKPGWIIRCMGGRGGGGRVTVTGPSCSSARKYCTEIRADRYRRSSITFINGPAPISLSPFTVFHSLLTTPRRRTNTGRQEINKRTSNNIFEAWKLPEARGNIPITNFKGRDGSIGIGELVKKRKERKGEKRREREREEKEQVFFRYATTGHARWFCFILVTFYQVTKKRKKIRNGELFMKFGPTSI